MKRERRGCKIVAMVFALAVLAAGIIFGLWLRHELRQVDRDLDHLRQPQASIEDHAASNNLVLLPVVATAERPYSVQLEITPELLRLYPLYLRPAAGSYLLLARGGEVRSALGTLTQVDDRATLLFTPQGTSLFVDGEWIRWNISDWECFWIVPRAATEPAAGQPAFHQIEGLTVPLSATVTAFPPLALDDGFMRTELIDGNWRIAAGEWRLRQHGGGMPTTDEEVHNVSFARAVNPFSVLGSGQGLLTWRSARAPHLHAEARFYFGIPRQGPVVDTATLPTDTDMLVAMDTAAGGQVGFGWIGGIAGFAIVGRPSRAAPWTVLARHEGARPPLTNWVKIGLEVRQGHELEAFLDDQPVLGHHATHLVTGPVHLASGSGLVEVDDVRIWSLPRPAEEWPPLYLRSRQFADKELHENRDGPSFEGWTRSAQTWRQQRLDTEHGPAAFLVTEMALLGDFRYASIPYEDALGELPEGMYEFRLLRRHPETPDEPLQGEVVFSARFRRASDGWYPLTLPEPIWPANRPEFALRFGREESSGNLLTVTVNDQPIPIGPKIEGALYLAIGRVGTPLALPSFPDPRHHDLRCRNLVQELFEQAPTEWNWVAGSFRMDQRWACADRWNVLVGGAPSLPCLFSKTQFDGNQEHEYYVSLRPAFPWDAGDRSFLYDPRNDPRWETLIANDSWYNRHDLNFSFCTTGPNPLSGYTVLFGAHDNTHTLLMRRGKVVATTDQFHLPRQPGHSAVHWLWYHFRVSLIDRRLRVYANGQLVFDYEDPYPIRSGHVALWSLRNAFTVTRYTGLADNVRRTPHFLYVNDDLPSAWTPLVKDAVTIQPPPEGALSQYSIRVVNNAGGGFLGVRWTPAQPVDLNQTPWLHLPLRVADSTRVNLHLEIGGRAYLVQVSAPLSRMKVLLTPQFEQGEQFRLPDIEEEEVHRRYLLATVQPRSEVTVNLLDSLRRLGAPLDDVRLNSLTVGNSSNEDYLLAGPNYDKEVNHGGNRASCWYLLGDPEFTAERPERPPPPTAP